MPKAPRQNDEPVSIEIKVKVGLTPNQIVARNMKRIRQGKPFEWSQENLAERFRHRGYPHWTAAMVSDAETADRADPPNNLPDSAGPRARRKPRQFTVEDLVALSRVLKVSLMDLLTPEAGEFIHAGTTINMGRGNYTHRLFGSEIDDTLTWEDLRKETRKAWEQSRDRYWKRTSVETERRIRRTLQEWGGQDAVDEWVEARSLPGVDGGLAASAVYDEWRQRATGVEV